MDRQDDQEYGQEYGQGGEYHDLPGRGGVGVVEGPKKESKSLAIKNNFNPLQKAPKGYDDKSFDKFRKSRFVTAINGYHHINKYTNLPKFFMPNMTLILNPQAAKENQEFFGLGTEILNPFAPIASLLVYAINNLDKDNMAGFIFLMIPTVPIGIIALLVDLVETMLKYVALAIPAVVAYPIMKAIDKANAEDNADQYFRADDRRISI